jgi:hypothetical protein
MIGQRVQILPGHPRAGQYGVVESEKETLVGPMWVIELESKYRTAALKTLVKPANQS